MDNGSSFPGEDHLQKNFDAMCASVGLKPWSLKADRGRWRELCRRLAGAPPVSSKKSGRKAIDDLKLFEIGVAIRAFSLFEHEDDKTPPKKILQKTLYARLAKYYEIPPRRKLDGTYTSPEQSVRWMYHRFKKEEVYERVRDEFCSLPGYIEETEQ